MTGIRNFLNVLLWAYFITFFKDKRCLFEFGMFAILLPEILKDFSVERVNVWRSIVTGHNKILLLCKALKFGVIFQNMHDSYKKCENLLRKFDNIANLSLSMREK